MRKEEFTFDSRDGKSKLYACKWIPEGEPLCVLQIIHGMRDRIGRYEPFAEFLAARGILVVGEDHLGHGMTASKDGSFGYFCENDPATVLVRDVHRLKKITEEEYPTIPYILFGHSMGSFILRNYLSKYGTGIEGAILCATGTPQKAILAGGKILAATIAKIKGNHYVSPLLDKITTGTYMSGVEGAKTKHDWLTTDEAEVAKFAADTLCSSNRFTVNGFHTLYELGSRMQKKENLHNIPKKLPILIVSGTEDPVGEKGLAPKKLYDDYLNLDFTKTTLKLYNGARHEILNEKVRETVYEDLYSWIEMVAMEQSGR